MRHGWAVLAVWLAVCPLARAGLYNTAEPDPDVFYPNPLKSYQDYLDDLRNVARPDPETPLRKRALLAAKVNARGPGADLTPEQRMDLGAYLVRLGRADDAVEVLRPLERTKNPFALATLAAANHQAGHFERAADYLEFALQSWPKEFAGLRPAQLKRYHDAEKAYLKLLRLRAREAARQRPGAALGPPEAVDDLFGVQFVGESGQYEPGKLAAAEKAKLPPNAVTTVQQLLVWQPHDSRLVWLLAELLNADGRVEEAAGLLNDLSANRAFDPPALREHRRALMEVPPKPPPPPPEEPKPRSSMTDSLTAAGVGAVAGMAVLGLVLLQVREVRRRRATGLRRG
jgi:tetratricopeptide (TPR) repeat protein